MEYTESGESGNNTFYGRGCDKDAKMRYQDRR